MAVSHLILFTILIFKFTSAYSNCFQDNSNENSFKSDVSEQFQQVLYENQLNFSLNLFHSLHKKHERRNLFFSPHSIYNALMLTLFGASGQTEFELRQALNISPHITKTKLLKQYKMEKYFMETRNQNNTKFTLKVANKIFFADTEPLRSCILEVLEGEIEQINFENKTEESRNEINAWVSGNTNGKIQNIIPPGVINPTTRIAIVNSAYFKGNWAQHFDRSKTKSDLFYVSPNEVRRTEMMHEKASFRHGISELLKAYILELPYEGDEISMFVLLPPFAPNALEQTLTRLTSRSLREAIDPNQLYFDTIEVALPKFHIEQTFELNKALETIGIRELFDSEKGNLNDFSEKEGLIIGTGRHRSFLEVNEEGSEGGGATVLIDTRSGRPLDQTTFICNHPFLFIIHDNIAKIILFMGAYTNPKMNKES